MVDQPTENQAQTTVPPTNTTSSTTWLALLLPYCFQAFVLIILTVILLKGDTSPIAEAVVSALLVVGTGSAIAGGSAATAHLISQNKS